VAQRHVTQLVGHHARQFTFVPGGHDRAGVYVHRPARKRERINRTVRNDFEIITKLRVLKFTRNRSHQSLADTLQVLCQLLLPENLQLLFSLPRRFPSDLHIVHRRVLVLMQDDFCRSCGDGLRLRERQVGTCKSREQD